MRVRQVTFQRCRAAQGSGGRAGRAIRGLSFGPQAAAVFAFAHDVNVRKRSAAQRSAPIRSARRSAGGTVWVRSR